MSTEGRGFDKKITQINNLIMKWQGLIVVALIILLLVGAYYWYVYEPARDRDFAPLIPEEYKVLEQIVSDLSDEYFKESGDRDIELDKVSVLVRVNDTLSLTLYLRYTAPWFEFGTLLRGLKHGTVQDDGSIDPLAAEEDLRELLYLDFFSGNIITRSEAQASLKSCSSVLNVETPPSNPLPYQIYSAYEGIRWDPESDLFALKATAEINRSRDECIEAAVDLRNGSLLFCNEVSCPVSLP